jgi:hypothetical protein
MRSTLGLKIGDEIIFTVNTALYLRMFSDDEAIKNAALRYPKSTFRVKAPCLAVYNSEMANSSRHTHTNALAGTCRCTLSLKSIASKSC